MSDQADAPANLANFRSAMASVDMSAPEPSAQPANDNARPAVPVQGSGRPGLELPSQEGAEEPQALEAEGAEVDDGEVYADEEQPTEPTPDPLDEDIHGIKARDILESIKKGALPAEALEKLLIEVKPNGEPRMVSIAEAGKGYMRQVDYTRGKQEQALTRKQHQEFVEGERATYEEWKRDPFRAERDLKKRIGAEALMELAVTIGKREAWLQSLPPREQQLARDKFRAEEQLEEQQEQMRQLREQAEGKKRTVEQRRIANALDQYTPVAFERAGVRDGSLAQKIYKEQLGELYEAQGYGDITLELCQDAANATAELLKDMTTRYHAEQAPRAPTSPAAMQAAQIQQQQRPSPMAPRRATSPAPTAPSLARTGGSPRDFGKHLSTLNNGRR